MKRYLALLVLIAAVLSASVFATHWASHWRAAGGHSVLFGAVSSQPAPGPVMHITPPLGLPPVPVPAADPVTAAKVALGRKLFFDTRLSADGSVSCASCHNPLHGFSDQRPVSLGVGGHPGDRNAPTVLNAAYYPLLFWDGRVAGLENQTAVPMANPIEMDLPHAAAVARLRQDPTYRREFQAAFGAGPIDFSQVQMAIASYERTLVSGDSPFDRYEYGGDKKALSPAAIRGLAVFENPNEGNCASCHTIGPRYALFTDEKFHNTGEGVDDQGNIVDLGRYNETKIDSDKGAFKTPDLRDVAQTAPYMHDGKLKTLADVVAFYAGQGNSNPYLDQNMKRIHLSGRDRSDLVEFLKSLTGQPPASTGQERAGQ